MTSTEDFYMKRALQIAKLGEGKVAPNPLVGSVIVHPQHGVIGEGFHAFFGGPHAEVNAISNVKNQDWLSESTIYVNLEPCCHFGKTPPCADLIIERKIPNVVICNLDPHPLVAGRGIQKLESAGIHVVYGVLENEGQALNKKFFTSQKKKRPFITLKWAQTRDGFVARTDGSSKWISSPQSRQWVHKMRSQHQAIFAGNNTLRIDNPELNVRDWKGPAPVRIAIDPNLKLPPELKIFSNKESETWIFNTIRNETVLNNNYLLLDPGNEFIDQVLKVLWEKGIHSLFVEGGSQILNHFIEKEIWDEAMVFTGPMEFGSGLKAPEIKNGILSEVKQIENDFLSCWHSSENE